MPTSVAQHTQGMRHDANNRYLRAGCVTGSNVLHNVRGDAVHSPNACVVFDDKVLDKTSPITLSWCAVNTVAMRMA
jgi:hypothetical protein